MDEQNSETIKNILIKAKEAEGHQNIEEAINLYQQVIEKDSVNELAYDRLMMLFRKQKEYKKELRIIKNGVKAFEDFYKSQLHRKSKTITDISKKLMRSTGLADKKGNSLYNPEPIARWKKRLMIVEKKMK